MLSLCAAKVRLDGDTWRDGAAVAVAESETCWGLPGALSVKLRLAFFAPGVCGASWTATVQLAETITVPPDTGHVVPADAIKKSDAFVPARVMLEMVRAALPRLVNAMLCAPLLLPTFSLPNTSDGTARLTIGAGGIPTPVNDTICSELETPPELS